VEERLADCPEGTNCYIKNEERHVWSSVVYICAFFLSCQGLNFTSDWCFVLENQSLTNSHYFFQKIMALVQYLDKIIAMNTVLPDRYSSIIVAPSSYSEICS
jgi:hypothetical protein